MRIQLQSSVNCVQCTKHNCKESNFCTRVATTDEWYILLLRITVSDWFLQARITHCLWLSITVIYEIRIKNVHSVYSRNTGHFNFHYLCKYAGSYVLQRKMVPFTSTIGMVLFGQCDDHFYIQMHSMIISRSFVVSWSSLPWAISYAVQRNVCIDVGLCVNFIIISFLCCVQQFTCSQWV